MDTNAPIIRLGRRIAGAALVASIGIAAFAGPASAAGSPISKKDFEKICKDLDGELESSGGYLICWLGGAKHCKYDDFEGTMECFFVIDDSDQVVDIEGGPAPRHSYT